MPKQHLTFRLSEESLKTIDTHASDLSTSRGCATDRTEALEDILTWFNNQSASILARVKKRIAHIPRTDTATTGQENITAFLPPPPTAENTLQLVRDQLEEALH